MEKSVGSAIEKIKLQEQDKEAKLKEKREVDTAILALRRAIHETEAHIKKTKQELNELIPKTDRCRAQLEVEKIRLNTLSHQVDATTKTLTELQSQADRGMQEVWRFRSSLNQAVQSVADECDIWALLTKPVCFETIARPEVQEASSMTLEYEGRLKDAKARKERIRAERDRLKAEPEVGEAFVRNIFLYRSHKKFSSNAEPNETAPIKFSTSPAARKTVAPIMKKAPNSDMPWYQPYSVLGSVTVFMIYFFVLREESNIDMEFSRTLYDRIEGLEKTQLLQSYRYNKENGLSVVEIEKRLKEIEAEEAKALA